MKLKVYQKIKPNLNVNKSVCIKIPKEKNYSFDEVVSFIKEISNLIDMKHNLDSENAEGTPINNYTEKEENLVKKYTNKYLEFDVDLWIKENLK